MGVVNSLLPSARVEDLVLDLISKETKTSYHLMPFIIRSTEQRFLVTLVTDKMFARGSLQVI